MKIINAPKIYLVGRQSVDDFGLKEFLKDHGIDDWESDSKIPAEILTEIGGRVCYMSFGKARPGGNRAFESNIISSGHGSVLEHAVFNFIVTGVSRSFSHEFVRHRAGMSPSQLSQRYVDESVAEYVIPSIINSDDELKEIWLDAVKHCHDAYVILSQKLLRKVATDFQNDSLDPTINKLPIEEFLKNCSQEQRTEIRKAARQEARSVLPNATETKIKFTANVRAIRHIIEMRGSPKADMEIRRFAIVLAKLMKKEAPNLFFDYEITNKVTTDHRKV